jgi:hypothetical protein
MYQGNHTLSIVATASFEPADDATLKQLEPVFVPLRGAKSVEKINEQKAEHSTLWQAAAQHIPHTVRLVAAHLVWYDNHEDDDWVRSEMRVTSTADIHSLMVQLDNCNLRKVRWIGDDTRLLAKYIFFEMAATGCLAWEATDLPAFQNRMVYGCEHFDFDNLLERGKSMSVPRDAVVHRLMGDVRRQLPDDVLAGDYLQLSTRMKEACFIAAGELPNLLRTATPYKAEYGPATEVAV